MIKKIILLGASGSIGSQVLKEIKKDPKNNKLIAISVGEKVVKIPLLLEEFPTIKYICVKNQKDYENLRLIYKKITFYYGDEGLISLIQDSKCNFGINALVGFVGVLPTIELIKRQIDIGLANKESLVVYGEQIIKLAKKNKVNIYPIDSEHVAIQKCLLGVEKKQVKKIILTCSGGPFLNVKDSKLPKVTVKSALKHPNWSMGQKITIDSATLMNKAFEVVEAYYLFRDYCQTIDVLIEPKSYVHSMVQFIDGSYKMDVGVHDMSVPISYAFNRSSYAKNEEELNLTLVEPIKFFNVRNVFKETLNLGYNVIVSKGNLGAILVSADDVSVQAFLDGKIRFTSIGILNKKACNEVPYIMHPTIKDILLTRQKTIDFVNSQIETGDY